MDLKPFNCTIRIFDHEDGTTLDEHILPVNSPDAEHAAASTLANAASFTTKLNDGAVRTIAFACIKVEPRS